MRTTEEKLSFLQNDFPAHLEKIRADTKPLFGKMSLQQMIEHFSDSVRIASGKTAITDFVTPPEQIDKMQAFMMSDKPFRENTPNPLLPETPPPVKHARIEDAISELKDEIRFFISSFEGSNDRVTRNPFFGDLDFSKNIQLLHKHAVHHLKQFGVAAE